MVRNDNIDMYMRRQIANDKLHDLEAIVIIMQYQIDGWSLYRVIRFFLYMALVNLPLSRSSKDQNLTWFPQVLIAGTDILKLFSLPRARYAVMFPDDISDWPLQIDTTHQLFIDDHVISEIEHLTRQYHQPVKHPKPLLSGGYLGVLYDSIQGQFRMWNDARYFTSHDGIQWDTPNMGPNGNLLIAGAGNLRGFMYNPDLPEEAERYKAVFERRTSREDEEPGGFYL